MKLLKGKKIADKILAEIKADIRKKKIRPALAVVLVGKNPASETYVRLKEKAAQKIGIGFFLFRFSAKDKEGAIIRKIKELNQDEKISGIIVQLPLPEKLDQQKILNVIDPKKDADGFSSRSIVPPVFPSAIMKLIFKAISKRSFGNKTAVIVCNSEIFGETMMNILKEGGIEAGYVSTGKIKSNLEKIRQADIIVSAVGKPGLIKGGMLKKGAIVIDGGITKKGKKVLGDVDFGSVKNKASYITPVPGGVGPVTIVCLLENVYLLAKKQGK